MKRGKHFILKTHDKPVKTGTMVTIAREQLRINHKIGLDKDIVSADFNDSSKAWAYLLQLGIGLEKMNPKSTYQKFIVKNERYADGIEFNDTQLLRYAKRRNNNDEIKNINDAINFLEKECNDEIIAFKD